MNVKLRRSCSLAVHLLILFVLAGTIQTASADIPAPEDKVIAANTAFGISLINSLDNAQQLDNHFISPLSITEALGMALNGASGDTRSAIARSMSLSDIPMTSFDSENHELLTDLNSPLSGVEVSIANALWADEGFKFNPSFADTARTDFGATVQTLDFGSPSAASAINGWVSDKTSGKITSIVSPRDLLQGQAVLTNAIYFHGTWSTPFDKSATTRSNFTLDDGTTRSVPLMDKTEYLSYGETADFQAVRVPYGSGRLAFYVFLPKPGVSLNALVASMTPGQWTSTLTGMKRRQIHLRLPKFKAETAVLLNKPLKDLGMSVAFTSAADFTEMGAPPTYIAGVIHKAVIEVNEEGTVAAAATGIVMTSMARQVSVPIDVIVDHPFLCAIRDDTTGSTLFLGAIKDPKPL